MEILIVALQNICWAFLRTSPNYNIKTNKEALKIICYLC